MNLSVWMKTIIAKNMPIIHTNSRRSPSQKIQEKCSMKTKTKLNNKINIHQLTTMSFQEVLDLMKKSDNIIRKKQKKSKISIFKQLTSISSLTSSCQSESSFQPSLSISLLTINKTGLPGNSQIRYALICSLS